MQIRREWSEIFKIFLKISLAFYTVKLSFKSERLKKKDVLRQKLRNSQTADISYIFVLSIVPSSFLIFQECFFYHFVFVQRTSFSRFLKASNSLSFPSSRKPLISPSFLKDIFTRYSILCQQFFSFTAWKMCCPSFLASIVSDEKSVIIQIVYFLLQMSFLFCFFQHFSWSLVLRSLTMTCLGMSIALSFLNM